MLIGAYWPGAAALELLETASRARHRSATDLHGYADQLQTISRAHLAGQEGVAAEAARALFARGADRVRATAERNADKRRSYESARNRVAALREDLTRVAEHGNAAIARIRESDAPAATKVSGIVGVITETQNTARLMTAQHAGHLLADIQTVLDAQGAELSATGFAAAHGVDPSPPHPPAPDSLSRRVSARLDVSCADSANHSTASSAGDPAGANGPAPERALAAAGPALTSGAGILATAAGGAAVAALAAPDRPNEQVTPPVVAAPVVAAPAVAPVSAAPAWVPRASAPIGAAACPPPASPAAARPRPSSVPWSVPAVRPPLSGPAGQPLPAPPTAPVAATVIRNDGTARAAVAESAFAGPSPVTDRLTPLLAAVVHQQPELAWAVGVREDGTAVVVTDLAGGWLPPRIAVPAGVHLPAPGPPGQLMADLIGECPVALTYRPGQPLPAGPIADIAVNAEARTVTAVEDLGWQLCQVTKWRDGLPRLAHTLARAAVAGTGWLGREAELLGEQTGIVAGRVLAGYPHRADGHDIGNWQLLATVAALLNSDTECAAYHFRWFAAGGDQVLLP